MLRDLSTRRTAALQESLATTLRSVQEPLSRLKQLLETDDGEAADFIVNERQRLAGVLTPAEIKVLTDRVGEFEFESALHCLSGIAARLSLDLEAK